MLEYIFKKSILFYQNCKNKTLSNEYVEYQANTFVVIRQCPSFLFLIAVQNGESPLRQK